MTWNLFVENIGIGSQPKLVTQPLRRLRFFRHVVQKIGLKIGLTLRLYDMHGKERYCRLRMTWHRSTNTLIWGAEYTNDARAVRDAGERRIANLAWDANTIDNTMNGYRYLWLTSSQRLEFNEISDPQAYCFWIIEVFCGGDLNFSSQVLHSSMQTDSWVRNLRKNDRWRMYKARSAYFTYQYL